MDRWFEINAYPSEEGLTVYTRDITDRKRSETTLRRLNEDLTQFIRCSTTFVSRSGMMTVYVQLLNGSWGVIDSGGTNLC